jgi:predicted DNA-binding protein with PD1-like motif
MEYKRFQNKYVVRLNSGDEIVESIKELAKKENIRLGTVSGIGAVNKAKIGLYELAKKEYHSAEFMGDMEIVSLAGNITEMNGEVYIHLHIALSDESYGVKAGHLYSATISATGELFIDVIDGAVDRVKDEKIGLNLIDFN